jgi:hypothetical protein
MAETRAIDKGKELVVNLGGDTCRKNRSMSEEGSVYKTDCHDRYHLTVIQPMSYPDILAP